MKKLVFSLCFSVALATAGTAQNIFLSTGSAGIGTTTPNAASLLEMKSTTQGLLIPKMTKAQRDAISFPPVGLMIYQVDNTPAFYYFAGRGLWKSLSGAGKDLANLVSPTRINADLLPASDAAVNIGSSLIRWKNSYFNGTVTAGSPLTAIGVSGTGSRYGVYGVSIGDTGIYGNSTGRYGVVGTSGKNGGSGVYGFNKNGKGVEGYSNTGSGVYGNSSGQYGVYGFSDNNTGAGVYGYGHTGIYGTGANGVYGFGTDTGVTGSSTGRFSVYGVSTHNDGYGIYGNGTYGVYGTGYFGVGQKDHLLACTA